MGPRNSSAVEGRTHSLRRGLTELREAACGGSGWGSPCVPQVHARLLMGFLQGHLWSSGNFWGSEGKGSALGLQSQGLMRRWGLWAAPPFILSLFWGRRSLRECTFDLSGPTLGSWSLSWLLWPRKKRMIPTEYRSGKGKC